MPPVLIVCDQVNPPLPHALALKEAIASLEPEVDIALITPEDLDLDLDAVYCPLTLHIPPELPLPSPSIFLACQDLAEQQQWVETELDYETGPGNYWLPIVWTIKGPLYGEVIGWENEGYVQPIDLPDDQRQPLYHLAYDLLHHLNAPPAVYTLQFALNDRAIVFDRLFPFPTECAIASLKIQEPDLLVCHWLCLTHQPILDLTILPQ
ncbi:hypothetical protein K4A83_03370 [Spirulina subsalsa FACHB-351]|uniref:Uncharacterized protein n=1 Tax=Spirulina subsalsa FACHB-351 TaxID=234711 RepID=A0ABT3L1D5_9CYAN|nr:hypothetical protein [Spirulina subsalsa]MCW6035315.1 hypothetical protein [Spirulina subsalsa FACHB-351]